ncbi:MAG: MprA protease, GlyGly-CTERM protein-sorting domain-containing form [Armatimonadetes bacterium]|nr:MprA protease, GlyGly-CTERM protein-sorting domain-containing form [Armatimonadota bacterium]
MTTPRLNNLSGKPTLGRYTILREVARSNDIVYEAVDPTINRRLAIKELNVAATVSGQAKRERIERFFREGRAAGAMNHPNIVTIFEVGEDNGRFFIAMEFLEGQSLRDRLHTAGALPLGEAVANTLALCSALTYAHERGVVHRDIKPDNVHIVPTSNGTHTVKLTDFGIARIMDEDSLTMAGQVFGTPSYMSPEQVTGNPIDGRSDQFSLGVLLYEMLAGRKPFTGDTVVTITYRILHETIPQPPGVPYEVAAVMERAMAKNASERFGSVAEFGAALSAALTQSQHGAQAYSVPAFAGAYNAPIAMTPTGGQATQMYGAQTQLNPLRPTTTGGRTGGNTGDRLTNPTSPSNLPQAPPRNSNVGAIAVATVVLLAVIGGAGFALRTAYYQAQGAQTQASLVKLTNDGYELAQQKRYEEAIALFEKVRRAGKTADPVTRAKAATNEAICYRMLGQQAQKKNDLAAAESHYAKAVEIAPNDSDAQTELATVRKMRGTTAPAPQTTTPTDPNNPLAVVLAPSPGAPAPGASPMPSPFAPEVAPGAQSASGFAAANAKAAQAAQELLAKGDAAFQAGQRSEAEAFWREAVGAGPGSSAALTADERIKRYGTALEP